MIPMSDSTYLTSNYRDIAWPFWPILPLYPYGKRPTLRREVIENQIWTFEQFQGIFYVVIPLRMTVIKLEKGGLLVYAPVAPTRECIRLVRELEQEHGVVQFIILPTISGLEHKVFVGPFSRYFPTAQVYIAPYQWSFPLNLPLSWLGFPKKRTHILPQNCEETPLRDEFDYKILEKIDLKTGSFSEVAFFHRRSQTLLVTDTLISVPEDPPAIVQLDPYPLLFHAKENVFEEVGDNSLNRRKGWQRIALFALYFRPSTLDTIPWRRVFADASKALHRSKKAYFGLFPFQWQKNWQESFEVLRNDGKLLVAPILQTLILNREPKMVLDWVNQVSKWDFKRVIPCHFSAPIEATPEQVRNAFSFLEKSALVKGLPLSDLSVLQSIDQVLCQRGITPPAKEKI